MKSWIVLLLFIPLVVSCNTNQKVAFPQVDGYDFSTERTIGELGTFGMVIQNDKIIFSPKHGFLENPLLYIDDSDGFDFNSIYKVEDKFQNKFYFRFGWTSFSGNMTTFSGLHWLKDNIIVTSDFEDYSVSKVAIDFLQYGEISVCTIGDSQTWFQNAQSLRRKMNQYDGNLTFAGSNCDIFGYPHEGEGGNNSGQVLYRIENIPSADYFTLLIGTNDSKNGIEQTSSNVLSIINQLSTKYSTSKIIYLSPIPVTNPERDLFNIALYKRVCDSLEAQNNTSQILYLDLGGKMRKNENWSQEYLTSDGLHQNEKGVDFMANLVSEYLKSDYKNL